MKLIDNSSKINWKFIAIVGVLGLVVGGGIFSYNYWMGAKPILIPTSREKEVRAILDKEFQLAINQTAFIESESLTIKLLAVTEDSRCPSDTQCIWAGEARALANIAKGNEHMEVVVSTLKSADVVGYSIKLVDLKPYPHTKMSIKPSDYVGTFVVLKNELLDTVGWTTYVNTEFGYSLKVHPEWKEKVDSSNTQKRFSKVDPIVKTVNCG